MKPIFFKASFRRCCRVSALVLFTVTAIAVSSNHSSPHADSDRELFRGPQSSGCAGADAVYNLEGTLQSWPATLAYAPNSQLSLSYAGFYGNSLSTSMVSYIKKLGQNSGFGFSLGYLHIPGIEFNERFETTVSGDPIYDPSLIRVVSSSSIVFRFGYGHRFPLLPGTDLSLGAAASAFRKNLVDVAGYGISADASCMLIINQIGARVGVIAENSPANVTYWGQTYQEKARTHVRFGVGWSRELPYLYGRIRAFYTSADLLANEGFNHQGTTGADSIRLPENIHVSEDPLSFLLVGKWGGEYLIRERVALRLGMAGLDRFAFGAGAHLLNRALTIDFAYILHQLDGTYQVGMTFQF